MSSHSFLQNIWKWSRSARERCPDSLRAGLLLMDWPPTCLPRVHGYLLNIYIYAIWARAELCGQSEDASIMWDQ